jgi:hypothetical protein
MDAFDDGGCLCQTTFGWLEVSKELAVRERVWQTDKEVWDSSNVDSCIEASQGCECFAKQW